MRNLFNMVAVSTFLLALVACGEDPNGNNPTGVTPTDPITVSGEVEFAPSFMGQSYNCDVFANGNPIGMTNEPIEMDPGTVTLTTGNANLDTDFDFPVHEMEDGRLVACAEVDATIIAGESQTLECEASVVFSGEYVCSTEVCLGDVCDPIIDNPSMDIHVNSDLEVVTEDGTGIGNLHFTVNGDQLISNAQDIVESIDSNIDSDNFSATLQDTFDRIHTITCIKQ